MPRKKLAKKKSEIVQVMLFPEDKTALDAWCEANSVSMSEIFRNSVDGYIVKGKELIAKKETALLSS